MLKSGLSAADFLRLTFALILLSPPSSIFSQSPSPDFSFPLLPPAGWEKISAKEWATSLQLPLESETKYQSSYRAYSNPQIQVLGANPKSIALIATDDHPDQLTLVFANKGDSAGTEMPLKNGSVRASSLEKAISQAISTDADSLRAKLSSLLGPPKKQMFGDFGKTRESAERWDSAGTAILLIEKPHEYVALRVLPSKSVDQTEKPQRISDLALRERMQGNVIHRLNGDIVVENIPMVDQGPKGYCVPATYARALLYAGVPADLYLLALLGRTDVGGGTSTSAMENSARALAATYGRSITAVSPNLDLAKLASFFEKGIPLTWAMFVDEEINRDLSLRLKERASSDLPTWNKILLPKRKAARTLRKNPQNGHVCLLIGCNRQTMELATSDSWGPEFAERWITLEEARALSQGDLGAIVP